jgi:hypothetical protein
VAPRRADEPGAEAQRGQVVLRASVVQEREHAALEAGRVERLRRCRSGRRADAEQGADYRYEECRSPSHVVIVGRSDQSRKRLLAQRSQYFSRFVSGVQPAVAKSAVKIAAFA